MLLGGLVRLDVRAVERDRDTTLDAERLPALLEHRVAGRLDHQPVEGDVVADEGVHVSSPGCGTHLLELLFEERHVAVETLRRLLRGKLLEHRADGVDLDQLVIAERTHPRAAERLRLDHAQELEISQRLAHGRLARAELARDAGLDEPLARLELSADDALQQDVLHLLPQHRPGDRAHATGLVSVPTPSISIVISSPGWSRRCGSRKTPTPAGVPVRIRSPASSVDVCEA